MKKALFTLSFLSFVLMANAQFHFGLRGGISSSQVKINETSEGLKISTGDNKFGYHIGVFAQIILHKKWVVQPELLFTSSGGNIDLSDGTSINEVWNLSFNQLDIPVTVAYRFFKFFRIQAGPVVSLMLKADVRNENIIDDVKNNYKNASWGYQAGIGFDVWKFSIDLKYQGSFNLINENNIQIPGSEKSYDPNTKLNVLLLSLGFRII